MRLSVVIPAFNESASVTEVIAKVAALRVDGWEIELVVVDDGSTDGTGCLANRALASVAKASLVRHPSNRGKGASVRSGIEASSGDYVVIQDADLEYDTRYIPELLAALGPGRSVVYGTRTRSRPRGNVARIDLYGTGYELGNQLLSWLTSLLYGQRIRDMETCYKLFPRQLALDLELTSDGFDFEPEITAKLLRRGIRIHEVPITAHRRTRAEGKKLRPVSDGLLAVWTLLKFRFRR